MLKAKELLDVLKKEGLTFLTGVPCSFFGDLLHHINEHPTGEIRHIMATSEGEAMTVATGYHISTGEVPLVYMQNSGLGNAINPLTSLLDEYVFGIPALLFITWRGESGIKDQAHHRRMGETLLTLLETLHIPYALADQDLISTTARIRFLKQEALLNQKPTALIIKSGIIEKGSCLCTNSTLKMKSDLMLREEAIEILADKIGNNVIIANLGRTSRELFELREKKCQTHQQDFLAVGSMGSVASIGLGVALHTERTVFLLDGDGSVLMKMGTLPMIGHYAPKNLVHIVIDNAGYESTGNQPAVSPADWKSLFRSMGYKDIFIVRDKNELEALNFDNMSKPATIIIKVRQGARANLTRPSITPAENKKLFMKYLHG